MKMELRSCSHEHFIQAIRGGVVIKVLNMNHRQRPALSFKLLKDVCESIDAKAPNQHSTISSSNTIANLPMVDRTLREIKAETDEFVPDSNVMDNDLDDTTTLKQLKDRFLKRKWKFSHSDEYFKQAYPEVHAGLRGIKSEINEPAPHPDNGLDDDLDDDTTLKQLKKRFHGKDRKSGVREIHTTLSYSNDSSVENETSLCEPIIDLKSKNSSRSKAKEKSVIGHFDFSSTTIVNSKTEQNRVSAGSQPVGNDLTPFILVKVKDEAKELDSLRETSLSGEQSFCSDEISSCPGGDVSSGIQIIKIQPEIRETLSSMVGCQICVTNEVSYDHLEDIEPISVFVPADGMNDTLKNTELLCHELLEEISEQNSSSCMQNIDEVRYDDKYNAGLPCEQDYSLSNPNNDDCPSHNSVNSLKADDSLDTMTAPDEQHPVVTCTLDDMTESGLTCRTYVSGHLKDEKQALESSITNEECQHSTNNQSFCVNMDSTIEPRRPPERLLSTRKAISPSSQEQLCSALKSDDDLCRNADHYIGSECKVKLPEVVNGKKASSTSSDVSHARNAVNHVGNGQVSQRRIYISSRNIVKKSFKAKANLEGPRYSRVLPNLTTECGSIQGCSERAIAFSQRQMQDMESLTFKLMDELESMKSIIEQKLLFEAYRNVSLKSDVDEVKSTIRSASKIEGTARKWLSMMAQDCRRFCKIMKLTPNIPESRDAVSRKRRKIVFADEAGGRLCHIKYFEAGVTNPVCDTENQ